MGPSNSLLSTKYARFVPLNTPHWIVGCCGILPVKRAYAFVGYIPPSDSFSTPQEINVFLVTSFIFAFSLSCHVLARAVSFILLQSSLMSLSETVMFWHISLSKWRFCPSKISSFSIYPSTCLVVPDTLT